MIAIERDDTVLTPHGDTEIRADDIVTVFSRDGIDDAMLEAFRDGGDTHVASLSRFSLESRFAGGDSVAVVCLGPV